MAINHLLSDTLTRIKNGLHSNLKLIKVLNSKLIISVIKLLYKEGYILNYTLPEQKEVIKNFKQNLITVHLKYDKFGNPLIDNITIISKPGVRKYVSVKELISLRKKNINLNNMYIISTSLGVLADYEAIQQNVGGELLCKIN